MAGLVSNKRPFTSLLRGEIGSACVGQARSYKYGAGAEAPSPLCGEVGKEI